MFIKYNSLENLHNVKAGIDPDHQVIVYEKIDGSNFSLCVSHDGNHRFASRNQLVNQEWNDLCDIVPQFIINAVKQYAIYNGCSVNLYGEVFSSKILKRFNYGQTRIRFFDLAINGKLVTQQEFLRMIESWEAQDYLCKIIGQMKYSKAVDIDVENIASFYDLSGKNIEGIVIKGYNQHLRDAHGHILIIKKKSKAFSEKSKSKTSRVGPEELTDIQKQLLDYVCESRVISAESKLGEFDIRKTGMFLKEISQDAISDFEKDTNNQFSKKDYMSKSFSQKVKQMLFETYNIT